MVTTLNEANGVDPGWVEIIPLNRVTLIVNIFKIKMIKFQIKY